MEILVHPQIHRRVEPPTLMERLCLTPARLAIKEQEATHHVNVSPTSPGVTLPLSVEVSEILMLESLFKLFAWSNCLGHAILASKIGSPHLTQISAQ